MLCFSTLSGDRHELRLLLVRLCDVRASISDTPPTRGAATSITYQLLLRDATTSQLRFTMTRLSVHYQLLLLGLQGATSITSTITSQLPTTRRTNQLRVHYYAQLRAEFTNYYHTEFLQFT